MGWQAGLVGFAALIAGGEAVAQNIVLGKTPAGDVVAIHPRGVELALESLPDIIGDVMERSGVPGIAVAVVHQGETVLLDGWGVADVNTEQPVSSSTVFQIASVSKPISATVAAIAVARGDVAWDDPVSAHLAHLDLSDDYVAGHATIGDFFAHRTGLPAAVGDELEDLGFSREDIIERLGQAPLNPFRISYNYANFGITIGAEAVAAATGMPWEELAQDYLFTPLAMGSTSYRHSDFLSAADRATLHAFEDGRFQPLYERNPDAQAPAGGVSSNVEDLALWLQLLLGEGAHDGGQLFDSSALLPALQPQVMTAPKAAMGERSGAYGYGFNVGVSAGGHPTMSHSGAFVLGAATHMQILSGADIGIVVLSNGSPIGAVESISATFMDVVQFGTTTRDWFEAYRPVMGRFFDPVGELSGQTRPHDAQFARALEDYVGRYDNAYFGPAEIREEGGRLVLIIGPEDIAFHLEHWDDDTFSFAPQGENAPAGSVASIRFTVDGRETAEFVIDYLDTNSLARWKRSVSD